MSNTKFPNYSYYILLILIWLYTFYQGVINPPFLGYYTVDENFIADSGIFLWYGITPRCLDWPASPSLLLFFIPFGLHLAIDTLSNIGTFENIFDVFTNIDIETYQYLSSRADFILIARSLQLIIVGAMLLMSVNFLLKKEHQHLSEITRTILLFLIITASIFWFNAPVLRPEAISGSMFLYLFVRLFFTDKLTSREVYIFAILFGIILAERLLFVFVAPILVGAIYLKYPVKKISTVFIALALTIGVFMAVCPFLITDPLVVLKSFFGGILAKLQDKPMSTFFNVEFIQAYFDKPVHYLIVILCFVGAWKLIRAKQIFPILVLVNLALFLMMVLHSAKIYDTHILPAGVITVVLSGIGLGFAAEQSGKYKRLLSVLLVLPIVYFNFDTIYTFQKGSHQESNFQRAYFWIKELPADTKLLLHPEFEFHLPKNDRTLNRELVQIRDSLKMATKLNFLMGNKGENKIASDELPYITRSFAFEDERQYEIQNQLLQKYNYLNKENLYDYDVLLESIELANHAVRTEDALIDLRNGKYEYMVTDQYYKDLEPVEIFLGSAGATFYSYRGGGKKK